jgi:hypothetical protein
LPAFDLPLRIDVGRGTHGSVAEGERLWNAMEEQAAIWSRGSWEWRSVKAWRVVARGKWELAEGRTSCSLALAK